jgi:hypothetical protein
MLQLPACPAVLQLPHWLMINACSACLPLLPQVFELSAAIDSTLVWQEVCLLAQCRHERIVPLLGVAIEVRRCCWLLLAAAGLATVPPACGFGSGSSRAESRQSEPFAVPSPCACPPCHALLCCAAVQGKALMVATQLMRGRSLRAALRDPRTQPMLRWAARCALLAAPTACSAPAGRMTACLPVLQHPAPGRSSRFTGLRCSLTPPWPLPRPLSALQGSPGGC